jgi:hypothetical protein
MDCHVGLRPPRSDGKGGGLPRRYTPRSDPRSCHREGRRPVAIQRHRRKRTWTATSACGLLAVTAREVELPRRLRLLLAEHRVHSLRVKNALAPAIELFERGAMQSCMVRIAQGTEAFGQ